MRYLIELSGESDVLALAEALALCNDYGGTAKYEVDGRALLIESETAPEVLVERLALAWSVSEHAFSCAPNELESLLDNLKLPGGTFRVRTSRLDTKHSPQDGTAMTKKAGKILSSRYRVDLEKPDAEIRILMSRRLHVGILLGEIDRKALESRKPDNRPFSHPISLHPKLARTLVNLTRVQKGGLVLDPFCGTGGILIEAGLMGCGVLGGDIDARMVRGTLMNLEHYGIAKHDVRQLDISDWPESHSPVDAIATDPPYGRSASTAREPIVSLYSRALAACHGMLRPGGRLAMALPSEEYIALANGFELEGIYPVRVHKSLTRNFCVFRKLI